MSTFDSNPATGPAVKDTDAMSGFEPRLHAATAEAEISRSPFSEALGQAFDDASLNEEFFGTAFRAARQAGCELLFEIPSVLLSDPVGRAAAISCGEGAEAELFFLLFNAGNGSITIIEASEVPDSVLDFTRSYAGVLSMIGSDRKLIAPLIQ